MNSHFWRNKRVLITGHSGFKGSWLSIWLHHLGADLKGFSIDIPTEPSLFKIADLESKIDTVWGDIRDYDAINNCITEFQPEIILHLAAQPLVRRSYRDPIETYSTNVMGVVNLLQSVRNAGSVKTVINVTSDKCYENKEWHWGYRESEPMGGYDPYSNSKGCAELVTSAFRQSFFNTSEYEGHGIALATARAGNVIGGGDWAEDRLIPDLLNAFSENKAPVVRNPNAIRPWQHVLEPLSGYLTLAEAMTNEPTKYAEGWNFGPDESDAQTVEYIANKMTSQWGDEAAWNLDDSNNNVHEATYLKLDCSKAKNILGWHPKWSLDTTIEHIISWQKDWLNNKDMFQRTVSEIEDYMKS